MQLKELIELEDVFELEDPCFGWHWVKHYFDPVVSHHTDMADLVSTLIMAAQNSYLCNKVHVVLHYLDSVLIWTPRAIFSPFSNFELDTGEALPGEGMPHQGSLQQIGESVK